MTDQEIKNFAWYRRMEMNLQRRRRGQQVAGPIDQTYQPPPLDMRIRPHRHEQRRHHRGDRS